MPTKKPIDTAFYQPQPPLPSPAPPLPSYGSGSIVKLRIGEHRWVPLLVIDVYPDRTVSGEVFTNGESDGAEVYVKNNCFHRPTKYQRTFYAERIAYGPNVGEWSLPV